jgi:D-arabinose 1-dehydrogenase-like Zn-dependent alcohol dehydrogenase
MKAAVVPAVSSSWQIKDVPQPQPGPGQVLVKMHASGICYTDVHQTLGHLPGQFPRILGHEPVGEIVAVAPDVTTRKVGDRVGSHGFNPPADAANGASAAAGCFVPI